MKVKRIKENRAITHDIIVYNYGVTDIRECVVDRDNKIVYIEGDKPVDCYAQMTKANAFLTGYEWGKLIIK